MNQDDYLDYLSRNSPHGVFRTLKSPQFVDTQSKAFGLDPNNPVGKPNFTSDAAHAPFISGSDEALIFFRDLVLSGFAICHQGKLRSVKIRWAHNEQPDAYCTIVPETERGVMSLEESLERLLNVVSFSFNSAFGHKCT